MRTVLCAGGGVVCGGTVSAERQGLCWHGVCSRAEGVPLLQQHDTRAPAGAEPNEAGSRLPYWIQNHTGLSEAYHISCITSYGRWQAGMLLAAGGPGW